MSHRSIGRQSTFGARASSVAAMVGFVVSLPTCSRPAEAERSRATESDIATPASFPALDFGDGEDDVVQLGAADRPEPKDETAPAARKCGGVAHLSCENGYICRLEPDESSDPMGRCIRDPRGESRRLVGEGERCGGIAGLECEDGLACKLDDTEQSDPMGTCVARTDTSPR
ncbi:MAG: hypothetical protein U0414_16060 [Polyangiaceae bacterium]